MAARTTKSVPAPDEALSQITTKFEAYTGDEPYLFVSYSHRDTEQVYPILDALYDRKYRIWYDESCENGNDFSEELRTRIKDSEAVLLFVSASSMASPFCGMEVIVACEYGSGCFLFIWTMPWCRLRLSCCWPTRTTAPPGTWSA